MQLKTILILSSSDEDLRRIEDQLRDEGAWRLKSLRITEALNGALRRAFADTDLAIVCCRSGQVSLLEAIESLPESHRPRVLVCGDLSSPEATRLLVRIGVVDLLPPTPTTPELQSAIRRALRGLDAAAQPEREARIISVFGATGGVGASLIAATLSHLVAKAGHRALLVDLDLHYAPLTAMLGVRSSRGINEAIQQVDALDSTALEGYVARHESGLHLLSGIPEGAVPVVPSGADFAKLLMLCRECYDFIFIVANRWLDAASIEAATESQDLLLVLGQSLAEVRHATRLRQMLTQGVGVPESVIRLIVNRYSTRSPVKDDMIKKAVGTTPFAKIPEDISLVRHSLDAGIPLATLDRHAPLTEALIDLERRLTGVTSAPQHSPVRRLFSALSRGDR